VQWSRASILLGLVLASQATIGCGQVQGSQHMTHAIGIDPEPFQAELSSLKRPHPACPDAMALVQGTYCIDRFEASLVEMLADGSEQPFDATTAPEQRRVRAVSQKGAPPQAYISGRQAKAACAAAGKRLCAEREWRAACKGARRVQYPYGEVRAGGKCNDHGRNPRKARGIHGSGWLALNDPALNQVAGTIAATGEHGECVTEDGVYDMVGNVHEWTADERGTFVGGYYLDTTSNGEGCDYRTTDHNFDYHDYSTGFRCCKDREPDPD
jgi:formylglycine-generating enzyme